MAKLYKGGGKTPPYWFQKDRSGARIVRAPTANDYADAAKEGLLGPDWPDYDAAHAEDPKQRFGKHGG